MEIEICKWLKDAISPVILAVDDFCNVWVDTNNNGVIDPGEDWGYCKREKGSSLVFLEEELLRLFPDIKVTFFCPVGIRSMVIENSPIPFISKMINSDAETIEFFKSVANDPRYEVAYHGTTHGKPGKDADDFIQEWCTFDNLEQASEIIQKGIQIFKETFGRSPRGGKYCGYESNLFSDESIEKSGFEWWCRFSHPKIYRENLTDFDVKYFGQNKVLDIPTTIGGNLLTRIMKRRPIDLKGIATVILKPLLIKRKLNYIDFLLNNKLIINVAEHIAPSRTDGIPQIPNIFDDLSGLLIIFKYLHTKPVWYCTCSELARYATGRDNINIELSENGFNISIQSPKAEGNTLTIRIKHSFYTLIRQPNGQEVSIIDELADIEVMPGLYELV